MSRAHHLASRLAMVLVAVAVTGCTPGPIDVVRLAPNGLASGLVAHWSFDDGSGTALHDDSGHQHDGAVTGAAWIAGKFGGALDFVAGNQVAVGAFPNSTASWSVSLWARVAASQLDSTTYVTLVSTEIPFVGGWEANVLPTPGDMHVHFGYWVGPGQSDYDFADCGGCLQPDVWTHLAAVVDGATRSLSFYVNGARVQSVAIRRLISPGSATLYMARWSETVPARLYTGALDDVAIYSRALVSAEIAALAAAPAPNP